MNFLKLECPFVHDRNFRAIMFTSEKITSFGDVNRVFFESALSSEERHPMTTEVFKIEHRLYYTNEDYTNNREEREACRKKWDGKMFTFRYSIFLAQFAVRGLNLFIIILPLMKMARILYPRFKERGLGQDVTYKRVDLKELILQLKEGKDMKGTMTIRGIDFDVHGDNKASSFLVSGSNVATSTTLNQIEGALKKKGMRYKPWMIKLVSVDLIANQRFDLSLYMPGHLKFFVNENTENFPMLGNILNHLNKLGLITEASFPVFRRKDGDDA